VKPISVFAIHNKICCRGYLEFGLILKTLESGPDIWRSEGEKNKRFLCIFTSNLSGQLWTGAERFYRKIISVFLKIIGTTLPYVADSQAVDKLACNW